MSILVRDAEVGRVYLSKTNKCYLVREKTPEYVIFMDLATSRDIRWTEMNYEFVQEVAINDLPPGTVPDVEFIASPPLDQPQNTTDGISVSVGNGRRPQIPGFVASADGDPDNREPMNSVEQPNAAVAPGGVIIDHNPLKPVVRPGTQRVAPSRVAVTTPKIAVPPHQALAPVPANPAVLPKMEPPAEAFPNRLVDPIILQQAEEIDRLRKELEAAKSVTPVRNALAKPVPLYGIKSIDSDPELQGRLMSNDGVPINELIAKYTDRWVSETTRKLLTMAVSGQLEYFAINEGKLFCKVFQA